MSDAPPTSVSAPRVVAAFAAIYLIWGTTYLAIRIGLESFPPFLMGSFRFIIAGSLLYAWSRSRGAPAPRRFEWKATAIAGAFLFLGGQGSVVWAETRITSGMTAVIVSTTPIWLLLIYWLMPAGRKPGRLMLLGLSVGLGGVVLLVAPWQTGVRDVDPVGVIAVLLGTISWSIGSLYVRKAKVPSSHFLSTAMQMYSGALLLGLAGTALGEWGRVDVGSVSVASWAAMLYLALAGSLVGFSAYLWLLRVVQPSRAATYAYVNPVVAVFLGWALADEALTPRMLLASAVILAAVVLVTMGEDTIRRPESPA